MFFVFLQFITFYIIKSNSSFQQAGIFNSSSSISGWIFQKKTTISNYFSLVEENENLLHQNASLKKEALKNYTIITKNNIELNGKEYKQVYNYQPANLISNSTNSRKNILTLNVGSTKGIKKEMGVISTKGIIGFVKDVSANYCTVMSLANSQFRLNVKPKGDSCTGLLLWNKKDKINQATVVGIPLYFNINKGDTIVTQGSDGIFPRDEKIGIVEEIKIEKEKNTYILKLKLTVDFYAISSVFVIGNAQKEELNSLQNKTEK